MELDNIIVTRLFDVMTIPINAGTKRQIRNRYGYGLTFCASPEGRIVYEFDGTSHVSDYGHAVLLPMGQTYVLNGISTGEFPLINFYCDRPLNKNDFAVFELTGVSYYLHTYEQIKTLCRYDQPFCYAKALSLFYELLSRLMVNSAESEDSVLSQCVAFMDNNYCDPELTMDTVAGAAHISTGYFRRIFKAQYSMSPKKYISNARMVKAKELLLGGSCKSVLEVAQSCGYTNIYHFDRVFREYTGCSPTEYVSSFAHQV